MFFLSYSTRRVAAGLRALRSRPDGLAAGRRSVGGDRSIRSWRKIPGLRCWTRALDSRRIRCVSVSWFVDAGAQNDRTRQAAQGAQPRDFVPKKIAGKAPSRAFGHRFPARSTSCVLARRTTAQTPACERAPSEQRPRPWRPWLCCASVARRDTARSRPASLLYCLLALRCGSHARIGRSRICIVGPCTCDL